MIAHTMKQNSCFRKRLDTVIEISLEADEPVKLFWYWSIPSTPSVLMTVQQKLGYLSCLLAVFYGKFLK